MNKEKVNNVFDKVENITHFITSSFFLIILILIFISLKSTYDRLVLIPFIILMLSFVFKSLKKCKKISKILLYVSLILLFAELILLIIISI